MDIARLQECLPPNRALVGIQPGEFGWGDQPGPAVAKALPVAAGVVQDILGRWSVLPRREVVNL